MAGQTSLGIPFLTGGDAPLLAQALQALASSVNGLLVGVRNRATSLENRATELERLGLLIDVAGGNAQSGSETNFQTVISGSSGSFRSDRKYQVTWGCDVNSTLAGVESLALVQVFAVQGATVNVLQEQFQTSSGTTSSWARSVGKSRSWSPPSGAWTVGVRIRRAGGSGGVQGSAGYVQVADVGRR